MVRVKSTLLTRYRRQKEKERKTTFVKDENRRVCVTGSGKSFAHVDASINDVWRPRIMEMARRNDTAVSLYGLPPPEISRSRVRWCMHKTIKIIVEATWGGLAAFHPPRDSR